MKKILYVFIFSSLLLSLVGLGATKVKAEDEVIGSDGLPPTEKVEEQPIVEEKVGNVVVDSELSHVTIEFSPSDAKIGDVVSLIVNPDFLYVISSVTVNGVSLVENEKTKGLYEFVLVEGENKVNASVVVDEQTLGELSVIYQEASDKDWTNLFTFENVITVIKWLLDGGILIAMARYFIKDKALEKKVEDEIKENMNKLIPEETKNSVVTGMTQYVQPIFEKQGEQIATIQQAMSTMTKCFALMQQGDASSKLAILQALSGLESGDQESINSVKSYIEGLLKAQEEKYQNTMNALNQIEENNKQVIEENTINEVENNGTTI